jgi:hypothetical protein
MAPSQTVERVEDRSGVTQRGYRPPDRAQSLFRLS